MSERVPGDPRLSPVKTRARLLGEGWTDQALRASVADGRLARVRHGAYVDGQAWRSASETQRHELRVRAVLMQGRTDMVVSHLSAAVVHEVPLWDAPLDIVDVTRRDGRTGRQEAGVRQHRGQLQHGDVARLHGLPVVTATRLALELTTITDLEHGLSYVNHLLHVRATTPDALRERYVQQMDLWPNSLSTDLALRLADPRIESVGESRAYHLCWSQGLPMPVPQVVVRDELGLEVARVDFAWPDLGAFMEFDGRMKYERLRRSGESAADVAVREKQREDLIRELTGWRCIRLTWADLYQAERTAHRIRRALFPSKAAA